MRRFKDKVLSLILSLNLIVNSVAPFFILAKPVVSAEPLKADINFKTEENTFSLSLNTTDNVEYVLGWKNQDGLQGTAKTKADSTGQNFIKDIYAGIKSGPDARRDEVVRGIYKIEVKTQNWITAIKFSLTDGILKEEGKQTYTPSGLDFSDDETKWMEEGDPGTSPTPTVTPTPTNEITPTAIPTPTVESGQILDGASDQNFMTLNVNGVVETQVIATAQCRADSLNGCLATDKPDYAPTEAVLVTGYGFAPNTVYTLKISSQDEPAVSYEAQITTDRDGSFTASYQLDGNYRPNYLVELKDQNGFIIALTSFTDSYSPVYACVNDSAGANDEPGQKDLTKMCTDYNALPSTLYIKWNWDDISWSGQNTGDACSLYDTDGDSKANYALCVGVNGNPATQAYTKLYSCSDKKSDRCTDDTLENKSNETTCSTSIENSDPFTAGDGFPNDTDAACSIKMSDVGGLNSKLIDVCSYPSGVPHSDPSDCIITPTANKTGKLEVKKDLIPDSDPGKFNLLIDGAAYAENIGDGGSTGKKEVIEGNHTVGESSGEATDLSNYTESIVCKKNGGTGSIVASSNDIGPLTVNVPDKSDIVCTITNTRKDNATITIIKDAVPDNTGYAFNFSTTGTGLSDFTLDDDTGDTHLNTQTFTGLAAGVYSVTEASVDGWKLTDITCSGTGSAETDLTNRETSITLGAGQNVTCTYTNSKLPKIRIIKTVVGGGDPADFKIHLLDPSGADVKDSPFQGSTTGTQFQLLPTYTYPAEFTVHEEPNSHYVTTFSGDCTQTGATDASTTLTWGNNGTCYVTNTKKGHIIVDKVTVPSGSTQSFDFVAGGTGYSNFSLTDSAAPNDQEVAAGAYTISETPVEGWTSDGGVCDKDEIPSSLDVGPGETVTCTFTNSQAPSLTLNKIISNNNGGTASESDWTLTADGGTAGLLSGPGASGSADVVSGPLFKTGTYVLSESAGPEGYTASDWSCVKNRGEAVDGNSITLDVGDVAVCSITNDDIQPKLIVHKTVIGGSATVSDFDYFVDYPKGSVQVESGEENGYDAGTYKVREVNNSGLGYTASFGGDCDSEGNVTLKVGDETQTCEITNTRDVGSLKVDKKVDSDGNGTYEGGNSEANALGFQWGTDSKTTDESMGATKSDLETNNYNVYENDVTDYYFAGWYYTNGEGSCLEPDGRDLPANVAVSKDLTTSITLCNARDTGSITVDKITDPEGDSQLFTIRLKQGETGIHDYVLSDSSEPETKKLLTGDYNLTELAQDGWDLTSSYCFVNEGETQTYVPGDTLSLGYGDNIHCTFENTKRGSVTVTKYNDKNGNGKRDEDESVLSGWDMTIAQQGKSLKETTGSNGNAVFANVIPGDYVLSETIKDNWTQTNISCSTDFNDERISDTIDSDNNHGLTVSAGANTICEVGNRPINPELQISKSNDGGNKSPGDLVTYTIKIKALNSQVLGVILKDLLPKGFAFQNVISIIKNGSDDLTAEVGDPHYHSPGTYNLGDMDPDDEIIIRYVAKIDGSQEFGLYKDIAWAKGTDFLSNKVLATAQDGYVDTNFVGTEVRVNGNLTENGNATVTEEGQVLGASTSILPATGANGIWVLIASLLSAMGLLILAIWFVISHKKGKIFMKKLIIITMFAAGLFLGGQVHASDLSIRLSEPKTPTKNTDFKLVFTVLDLTESGNPITAKCFYKKTLSDGWTQFDSDKTLSAGGNTDSCQVNSGIINASGHTYYFKATATNGEAGDDTESQGLVSVTYDNSDPGAPTNYKKEKISSCQYKISFKTANDGMTTRVEIYRSDSTSMALDGSTRVGDMTVGPNTESSFTESVPDCNKTYYYVIRAFNEAGNGSGPIGDSVVITTTTTSTTTQESGAIPVSNVTLPGGGGGSSGQVLGEQNKASTPEASPTLTMEEINVKGASTSNVVGSFVSKNKKLLAALSILILAIIVYVFIRIKNRK